MTGIFVTVAADDSLTKRGQKQREREEAVSSTKTVKSTKNEKKTRLRKKKNDQNNYFIVFIK